MKKIVVFSMISFFLGALVYGLFFLYLPKSKDTASETSNISIQPPAVIASSSFQKQPDPSLNFVKVAERVAPAVVNIESTIIERISSWKEDWFFEDPFEDFWRRFFGYPPEEREYEKKVGGSGFIIDPKGYIVTNNHVVQNAKEVWVYTLDEREFQAKIIGTDPKTDLALLKIKGKNLPYVKLGNSDNIKVGEWVLAIGNPFGLSHTVTAGIVSAKGRHFSGKNIPEFNDFIQTDAAINRGNSGGPLVNMKGEVIGITSNIYTPTGGNVGIGFAIPSNMAKVVIEDLKEKGKVVRGHLGVWVQEVTPKTMKSLGLKEKRGALVARVQPGSPADKVGIKRYDVIVEFNGVKIKNTNHLKFKVAETPPGTEVKIKVIRNGKEKTFTVILDELEPVEETGRYAYKETKDLGMRLTPLTPRLAREHGYRYSGGLLVTYVKRNSEAYRAGIRAGDVILEVNRKEVNTIRDFERILKRAKSGDILMLLVRRGEYEYILYLKIP
ncbi:DegQ family serine endoprotease [Candidatus Aminicenantes bacterium AH-873-B07]|jgi:serine protease Do|nr:DegQ family serine endoprotease [Candidatus Aminicenantes bacterium AH-873-B07]